MARNKTIALADLKRHVRASPASVAARPAAAAAKAVPAAPGKDDAALFKAAVEDVRSLPASNRAEIKRTLPAPVPRPRTELAESAQTPATKEADQWLPAHWLQDSAQPAGNATEQLMARALQGVVPIRYDKVHADTPKPLPVPLQHERDEQAALAESIYAPTPLELVLEGGDELYYLKEGLPRTMLRDLRRGRWVVQAELDLHGANRDEARDLLAAAFAQWRKQDIRCVRVIHGKGLGSPGKEPVLKKLVAGWLMNYDDVLVYTQARVHDGGAGALLVLMRAARR
ncbi:Smr/MutS family protein [Uliginosibacterium sediminicola]|uniref:Smr/MutS family protein n=1 Tax=Uliginosibacterium sediminicola TaxID=2024550 RepID=A0ABU9Z0U1_9RHOO